MLTISAISKSFGGRLLFQGASLQVNRGDRIGLVGANGAGKTTLFSIILGEASPDEGRISMERGITFGFLPQESAAVGSETVIDLVIGVTPELIAARDTMRKCEAAGDTDSEEYHHALGEFAEHDGHGLTAKGKRILAGLAFREKDVNRPAAALSGGWIMRAHLARLLTQEPDLLLLDEPTNHLDLESLVWFREYLRNYPGAIVMISHDRDFLNELVRDIVEISRCKLNRYRGNYDSYLAEKAARDVQHAAAYANQQREIDRLQDFVDRFRAKASKATQAQSKLKQIERMDLIEAPPDAEARVKFRFPQPARSGHRVIAVKDVDFAYKRADADGDLVVYRGLNFEAERGQRTVLVGPNGAGKSTLIKLLAGILTPQRGEVTPGHNVRTGYFAQQRVESLNMKATVLECAQDLPSRPGEQLTRTVLGSFLFRGDDVFKPVAVLSGGEKSRLALARLLLDPPNLMLLDEPTTHLDIPSIDALIGALEQYEGTVIFISHDVHFIRRVAKNVLHISAGQLTPYAGDYQYYLDKTQATSERGALVAGDKLHDFQPTTAAEVKPKGPGLKEIKERERAAAAERKAAAQAKRDREKRVAALELKVAEIENRQREVTQLMQNPIVHLPGGTAPDLSRELTQLARKLYETTTEWERELALLEEA